MPDAHATTALDEDGGGEAAAVTGEALAKRGWQTRGIVHGTGVRLLGGMSDKRAAVMVRRRGAAGGAAPPAALYEAAMMAHASADFAEALKLWAALRKDAPGDATGYLGGIVTAKAAGREDLAGQLAEQGAERLPAKADALREAAAAASWEAADTRWQTAIRRGTRDRKAALAAALSPLKQTSPDKKLRRDLALARLAVMQERFPRAEKAFAATLSVLRGVGRFEAAADLAAEYAARFPGSVSLALEHLALLDKLGRHDKAFETVTALRQRLPPDPLIEVAYCQALAQVGQLDAAEEACVKALAAFPDSTEVAQEHATMATRRGDWTGAIERLQDAETRWPGRADIKRSLKALRLLMVDREMPPPEDEDSDSARMFAHFESLGGSSMGCEFGIVQRHFGSVALGLLRWSTVGPEGLCAGLRSGFAGLGEPDNVIINTYRNAAGREEYVVNDHKYGFDSHTYIATKDAPADKMHAQTARRLTYMAGKLIDNLEAASKVFVYKLASGATDEAILSVFEAARSRGPVTLLCVVKTRDAQQAGSIRRLRDDLYVGHVNFFMGDGPQDIDFVSWKALCTAFLAVRADTRAAA